MVTGAGIYFDGVTSARRDVRVTLGAAGLVIEDAAGRPIAEWPYDALEQLAAPAQVLRVGRRGSMALERLEIFDTAFAHEIDLRAHQIDRTGALQRRQRKTVVVWSVGATLSLLAVAWFGIPAIAERLAPLVPPAVERKLGAAVDMQVRGMLDTKNAGDAFECRDGAGRAALAKIISRLEAAAGLPSPLHALVVRRDEANALALPGGQIYVFRGLIEKAGTPDEVAGVLAHEIGHVAHRDGTKSVLQGGGLSLLFGMLLGDFVGGGAVVVAAKAVLQSSYSREAESAADAYAAGLMRKAEGDTRALGTMLGKIGGATEPGVKILLDHPETAARIAAINRLAAPGPAKPFLTPAEWTALKRICAG